MPGFKGAIQLLAMTTLLVVPVKATTTYFAGGASAEAGFTGALGTLSLLNPTLTFSAGDLAPGGLFNANGTGINFSGFDDYAFNTPTDLSVNSGKLTSTQAAEVVTISFPSAPGIYAFGIHVTVVSGTGLWCVELTHGTCNYPLTNASNSAANIQFFGFVSDTPVTAPLFIRPAAFSPTLVIPDFQAYSVPEPHTMSLIGLGLVILSFVRRKTLAS